MEYEKFRIEGVAHHLPDVVVFVYELTFGEREFWAGSFESCRDYLAINWGVFPGQQSAFVRQWAGRAGSRLHATPTRVRARRSARRKLQRAAHLAVSTTIKKTPAA